MGEITVASMTDSIEEVRQAAGLPAVGDEPETEETPESAPVEGAEPSAGTEPAQEEGDQEGTAEGEVEEDGEAEPERRRAPGGVQKKIDKLTAIRRSLETKNAELERRLHDLEAKAAQGKPEEVSAKLPEGKPKPNQNDFKTYEEFIEALTDWKADQREAAKKAEEAKVAQQQAAARQQETFDAYNAAADDFREEHPDFNEVLSQNVAFPKSVEVAIIGMRDKGPEVAYALVQDEKFCEYLVDVMEESGDAAALVEFGAWVSETFPRQAAPGTSATPSKKPAARPPAPIKPVGASASRTEAVPLDESDYRTYRRIRDEQERALHRR